MDAEAPLEPPKSNLELLFEHLEKDSLAHKLVTACRGLDSSAAAAALKRVLQARLKETLDASHHAKDQLP